MKISGKILILCVIIVLSAIPRPGRADIITSQHNLSTSGTGTFRAVDESRICIFCHTPHNARDDVPFLWNREDQTTNYIPYTSTTLVAAVGQPTGASRLCLSCHDGTIALGAVLNADSEIAFTGGVRLMPGTSPALLGTNLSDDHPVSLIYDSQLAQTRGELVDPALLPDQVKVDDSSQLQCTACHDPHNNDLGNFLVMTNTFGQLCNTCHQLIGWNAGSHAVSNAQWNSQGVDPWPNSDLATVAENACTSCHRNHSAPRPQRILNQRFEEDTCLACHNGNVAQTNIEVLLTRPFRHPVQDIVDAHDAAENFALGGVPNHVECVDCHNPHQANGVPSPGAPLVSGATTGVTGIDLAGLQVDPAPNLYEICFKCHGDNNVIAVLSITRQIPQLNTRLEFTPGNPSYHPVAAAGVNPNVPSLAGGPFNTSSLITCVDCHNNDDPLGPRGPHGSNNDPLLELRYVTADNTTESPDNYALCYKCHNRNNILGDNSFSLHNLHIVEENAPCSACHDPHGISNTQGNVVNNTHLINFDTTIVQPNGGTLAFVDDGALAGNCTLVCHGEGHNNEDYP